MKMRKFMSILVIGIMLLSFVSCGKKEEKKENTSSSSSSSNSNSSKSDDSEIKNAKNNVEKMMIYIKRTGNREDIDYGRTHVKAPMAYHFSEEYKDDIVNPYTKNTTVYSAERGADVFGFHDQDAQDSCAHFMPITTVLKLKDFDKSKVKYGCNKANKGVVIAIVIWDAYYAYEIDENGNKINEILYEVPQK